MALDPLLLHQVDGAVAAPARGDRGREGLRHGLAALDRDRRLRRRLRARPARRLAAAGLHALPDHDEAPADPHGSSRATRRPASIACRTSASCRARSSGCCAAICIPVASTSAPVSSNAATATWPEDLREESLVPRSLSDSRSASYPDTCGHRSRALSGRPFGSKVSGMDGPPSRASASIERPPWAARVSAGRCSPSTVRQVPGDQATTATVAFAWVRSGVDTPCPGGLGP